MIKSWFTTNVELKLSSLAVAVILWFFVMLSGRSEISVDVPVIFMNIPEKLEVLDSPETIRVNIEGQDRILRNLRQNEVRAVIDLNESKAGRAFFTLSKNNIELPKMLVVTSIDPETISLKIEAQLNKTVSVKPSVTGLPEKGFVIADVKVVPETVILEGPKSAIAKIYSVKTEPLDITGINSDLRYRANLNLTNANIRKNINKVDVLISVEKIRRGDK
jgi:YbbR domain-containing protein